MDRFVWIEVRSGVLQRSVLGPILFTIFINGIYEEVLNVKFLSSLMTQKYLAE